MLEHRPDPRVVAAFVLIGGLLIAGPMAVLHADTLVDLAFLIALNMVPYYMLTLVARADIKSARRKSGFVTPIVFAFVAITVTLLLERGPLYQSTAGAPVIGVLLVPIETTLIGGIGCLLGWWVALTFKQPQRFPTGHCQSCGYDLRGLPEGTACPECGEV